MALRNRKQIPICRECHNTIHKGEYNGKGLKTFNVPFPLYDNRIICSESLINKRVVSVHAPPLEVHLATTNWKKITAPVPPKTLPEYLESKKWEKVSNDP